jgi:hypothetical protein
MSHGSEIFRSYLVNEGRMISVWCTDVLKGKNAHRIADQVFTEIHLPFYGWWSYGITMKVCLQMLFTGSVIHFKVREHGYSQ